MYQGRIQGFKLGGGGGAHLKKLRRVEGGANIFAVFRVKNNDFTPKNHISSNCGGRREICLGVSCEKSRFYANFFFSNFRGARAGCPPPPPPWIRPCVSIPKRRIFLSLFLLCAYDSSVLRNFKIFTHLLPNFSYKDPRRTEVTYHCINFNGRVRNVPNI